MELKEKKAPPPKFFFFFFKCYNNQGSYSLAFVNANVHALKNDISSELSGLFHHGKEVMKILH